MMLETAWQDVRYGLRLLRRSPLFTATAIASLAIGIGANTTIFSIASAMLLRPLPGLSDPGRLVDIGRTRVAVISYELWQRRFGGSADTVGRVVPFNSFPVTIVGVAPPRFQGTTIMRADAWVPLAMAAVATPRLPASMLECRPCVWLMMGARLKPGVTAAQANAEMSAIGAALEKDYPEENRGKGLRAMKSAIVPGRTDIVAGFIAVLLAIAGLVLLAACVNLAGMLLARAASRGREIAVRLAIGAGRTRLVRQLITETLVLFVAGCGAGLLLTRWLTMLLLSVLPSLPMPVGVDFVVDWCVVTFSVVISLAAAVLSGLAPALQASRADLAPALKVDAGQRAGRARLRSVFIVAQVAVSLVLVIAGALFVRALARAASIDPGFDQRNVDVVTLDLSMSGYKEPDALAFADRLRGRVRALPGVENAAFAAVLPLNGNRMGLGSLRVPGLQPPAGETSFPADWNAVSPDYFRTLSMRLTSGRDFSAEDTATAPRVIIINETMARSVWHTTDVLGRQFVSDDGPGSKAVTVTVVGVAPDAQVDTLGAPVRPLVYVPLTQRYLSRVSLVVKSAHDSVIPQVRGIVRELNPNLPVTSAMALSDATALLFAAVSLAASYVRGIGFRL